ncbi:MAG: helix-turn-helix domain-containing protein [Pseudomonadota bacterium]
MKSYGQFCPVAKAAEVFCERWTALVIRDLAAGPRRFSELKRGVPLMSPSLLSKRLKQLTAEGIVERQSRGGRASVYVLTEAGQEFAPIVWALGIWGQRWSRRELREHEIDLGLLLWSIEDGAEPAAFGGRDCLVRLDLTDQPTDRHTWWFMNARGKCELCLEDPGGDVDLYLSCTLPDAIHIIRGDIRLALAIDSCRLEVLGETWARSGLEAWINLSALTEVEPQFSG